MSVQERPLLGLVDLQRLEDGVWVTTGLNHATGVTISRGGVRRETGTKADVGLGTIVLHNAEDPLAGGTYQPGQNIRIIAGDRPEIIPPAEHYWFPFDAASKARFTDEWEPLAGVPVNVDDWPIIYDSELATIWSIGHTLTDLEPGRAYEVALTPWVVEATQWRFGVPGQMSPWFPADDADPVRRTHRWTAATDTDQLILELRNPFDVAMGAFNNLVVTRAEYLEDARTPIFTARVSDVDAAYPLNKSTGRSRTTATVTVSDAVAVHGKTPRFGAMIGAPYYETFEARIARLAASAQAPLEVPVQGAAREVYAL